MTTYRVVLIGSTTRFAPTPPMHRRTFLVGAGITALAGCLSAPAARPSDAGDSALGSDAPYVRRGPEGYFSAKGPWNTDLDGVVIHGYDLVEYHTTEHSREGSPDYAYDYDDVTFRFVSAANRDAFATDPDAYVPAFGGYCSLGVGNGYKDGMHPEAFDVIEGTLYFNLTPAIHEGWLRNYEQRIATADQRWTEIKHSTESIHIGPGLG